ncbi:MAG: hypothetical protein LBB53_04870, partial [Prevotellaceae bacterium]|nr:hypothetical protein [Prevotellaceae bacterium]
FNNVATSTLDEWIYYFKNSEIKEDFTAKGMEAVKTYLDFEKLTSEQKREYEKDIDKKLGWNSAIESAEKKGKAEGKAEGEKKKETEFVLNLHKDNISIEKIAEYANLSIEKVKEILKQKID